MIIGFRSCDLLLLKNCPTVKTHMCVNISFFLIELVKGVNPRGNKQ